MVFTMLDYYYINILCCIVVNIKFSECKVSDTIFINVKVEVCLT